MKFLDALLACPAVLCFPKLPPRSLISSPESFLVIRPGGIGDAVLLIPLLQQIVKSFSGSSITVLAEKRNAAVFHLCDCVNKVYCYDKAGGLLSAIQGNYDVVIDSEQWHRMSALVARMPRSKLVIGFATNVRSRLFSHQVGYSHEQYEVESFLNLLHPFNVLCSYNPDLPFLNVPATARKSVDKLLPGLENRKYAVIFPGASIDERKWGGERFAQLAGVLNSLGLETVVVGGKDDYCVAEEITAKAGVNLTGKTNLAETAAVIARSLLLISGDSGILHIAVGLNVPTVSLFGPGRSRKWAPPGRKHTVINRQLSCSPCTTFGTTPRCRIDAQCMKDITVEEVTFAVKSSLLQAERKS